jgi:hypothetical protein
MTARELLHAEIDALDDRAVAAVHEFVRQRAASKDASPERVEQSGDLFTLLRTVKIEGPVEFSANLDLYMNGVKSVSDNIR